MGDENNNGQGQTTNVYLATVRQKYDGLRSAIAGLQAKAVEEKRDLSAEEMRSVTEMSETSQKLYAQIESLTEVELRDAKTRTMQATLDLAVFDAQRAGQQGQGGAGQQGGQGDAPGNFRAVGGARTQDRDPGIYTQGGQHSYLGDQYRAAKMNDREAKERLEKHSNALRDNQHLRDVLGTTTGGGVGLVPPVWLAEQFAPILHRRLRVAAQLRSVPWAGPFPWTIPVAATAATGTAVAEGSSGVKTDPTYTTITVLPTTLDGFSDVSRQLLEASNPAVDAIIWGDLLGNFYDNAESLTIAALEAQTGVNLQTCTGTTIDLMRGVILDGASAISDNSAGDADIFVGRTARWTTYLKLLDGQSRPLILAQNYNPMNQIGSGDNTQGFRSPIQGSLENFQVVTSPTVGASRGFLINSQELLFSISPPMQFQFEQPVGPALIRIGVWGYAAVVTGRRPKAITKITYNSN